MKQPSLVCVETFLLKQDYEQLRQTAKDNNTSVSSLIRHLVAIGTQAVIDAAKDSAKKS